MRTKLYQSVFSKHSARTWVLLIIVALFASNELAVFAQEAAPAPSPAQEAQDAPKIPNDQLDSLVAPIALYPDPLLSQVLVASTYPLELIQLQQYLEKTAGFLSEKTVTEAVQKEDWDPSVQAMAVLPTVVKRLAENITWTTDLGNAFLSQQSDVMDAVQRMRTKAKEAGKLQSNEQMKVETRSIESKSYVVIEQASPAAGTLAAAALAATALAAEIFRKAWAHATPARLEVADRLGAALPGPVACAALPAWVVADSVVAAGAECEAGECEAVAGGSERNV